MIAESNVWFAGTFLSNKDTMLYELNSRLLPQVLTKLLTYKKLDTFERALLCIDVKLMSRY